MRTSAPPPPIVRPPEETEEDKAAEKAALKAAKKAAKDAPEREVPTHVGVGSKYGINEANVRTLTALLTNLLEDREDMDKDNVSALIEKLRLYVLGHTFPEDAFEDKCIRYIVRCVSKHFKGTTWVDIVSEKCATAIAVFTDARLHADITGAFRKRYKAVEGLL